MLSSRSAFGSPATVILWMSLAAVLMVHEAQGKPNLKNRSRTVLQGRACRGVVCSNGGRCKSLIPFSDPDTGIVVRKHVCVCKDGSVDRTCDGTPEQVPFPSSPCQPSPCLNNAKCSDISEVNLKIGAPLEASNFSCACPYGFLGDTCADKLSACGPIFYDRVDDVCCAGTVFSKRAWYSCCQSQYLPDALYACCGTPNRPILLEKGQRFFPNPNARVTKEAVKCCGEDIYFPITTSCCFNSTLVDTPTTNPSSC